MIKFLWSNKTNTTLFIFGLFFSVVTSITGIYLSLLLGQFIDSLNNNIDFGQWLFPLISLLIIQTFSAIISQYALARFGADIFKNMQEKIFAKLIRTNLPKIDKNSSSSWSSHLTTDILSVRSLLSEEIPELIIAVVKVIFIFVIIMYFDWYILIPIFLFSIVIILIAASIGNKLDQFANVGQGLIAKLNSFINDTILNIKFVKSEQQEELFINKNKEILQSIYRNHLRAAKVLSVGSPIMNSLLFMLIITLIFLGGSQISSGYVSVGMFLTISVLILESIPDLMTIFTSLSAFQEANGKLRFLVDFMNDDYSIEKSSEVGKIQDIRQVSFNDVSVSMDDKPLFKPISFNARLGEIIILEGKSGVGKTHLFDGIVGFNNHLIGEIFIDETPIQNLSLSYIRQHFSYCNSVDRLVSGTVKDNIFSTRDVIERLLEDSEDDFLNDLKNNLDKTVINLGENYSTGQRQKVKTINSLTSDSPILLLDEPSSGLDKKSKYALYRLLKNIDKKIIIMISHDSDDKNIADKVIKIDAI